MEMMDTEEVGSALMQAPQATESGGWDWFRLCKGRRLLEHAHLSKHAFGTVFEHLECNSPGYKVHGSVFFLYSLSCATAATISVRTFSSSLKKLHPQWQ